MAASAARARIAYLGKALAIHARELNFRSVKSLKFSYNPFCGNTESVREVSFQMSVPKRRSTNPACAFINNIRSDFCDPSMEVVFSNGHKAVFKTDGLNAHEILQQFNKLCVINDIKTSANK